LCKGCTNLRIMKHVNDSLVLTDIRSTDSAQKPSENNIA